MRIGICVAALVLAGWVTDAAAELTLLSIPGNDAWADIQQPSVSQNTYIELVEFERYEGGIAPIRSRIEVRYLIDRAHGLTSSYVTRDIGAPPSGR